MSQEDRIRGPGPDGKAGWPGTCSRRASRRRSGTAHPERCASLAAQGARVAATPRELAEGSDVVVACVADPPAVERLVFAADGLLGAVRPGFRLECSTVSPELTRRVQKALRERGADALEAPVTGSKNGAENATLLFMTGGERAVHDELQAGDDGDGHESHLLRRDGRRLDREADRQQLHLVDARGALRGVVVGRKGRAALEKILEVVKASGFASPYFPFKGAEIGKRDFAEHFAIDLLVKDQTTDARGGGRRARFDARAGGGARGVPVGSRPRLRAGRHLRRW